MPLLPHLCFQINIEDLDEAPGVNGERTDCLLVDAVVSGNKRRAQSGHSESTRGDNAADTAVPSEQVRPTFHPAAVLCDLPGSLDCLGSHDQTRMDFSRLVVAGEGPQVGASRHVFLAQGLPPTFWVCCLPLGGCSLKRHIG